MRYLLPFVQAIILSSAVKRLNHKKCHAEVSDEFRWTALYRMNFYREMLAQGMAPNKTGMLPGAKNMYKLLYDCALEDISYKVTSVCASNLKYDPNGIIYGAPSSAPKSAASAPAYLSETISDQVRDTQYDGLAADVKVDWYTTYWTMWATGKRTRVGCSYKMDCNTTESIKSSEPYFYHFVCTFDTEPAAVGEPAYDVGPKCTQDSECTTYPGSICDVGRGLCEFYGDAMNIQCPGNMSDMIDPQRTLVVNMHNKLRSSLAKGNESDLYGWGKAPSAKRMTKMKYNCEAEKSAHEWAAQCQVAHSSNRNKTGENLYFKFDNQQEPGAALTAAMQQWWGELAQYGVGPEPNLTDSVWQRGVGHYTQMAWQETTEVGCAWAHCPDFTYVVCHYKPAGNYMNELIYERGTPCQTDADCGSGRTCLVDEALCQV